MLHLDKVNAGYGAGQVLFDLSIRIEAGECVSLMGRNGMGKSTMLRMMCGMEKPNRGEVIRHSRVSWPLGLGGSLQGSLTGIENTKFVSRIYGVSSREAIDFVQSFSDLGKAINLPVKTYSSGMRARLTFAISMALKFRCYLIDELTAVGDLRFRKKCEDTFAARRQSADVIIVAHQLGIIRQFADSAAVLHNGELLFFNDVDDAIYYYNNLP